MSETNDGAARKRMLAAMLGALGVVYGDIGTSPLYALHESFFGHHPIARSDLNVLGVLSFFFWSLLLIVGIKYLILIMRADNRGEGGIFSLLALLNQAKGRVGPRRLNFAWYLIIFGAALLLADGLITPAISVLSAVSGIKELTVRFDHLIVPVTVGVLLGLFALQPFGTHRIGRVFGPVMLIWFTVLALLGLPHIVEAPKVLLAVNPWYGILFVAHHGWSTMWTLGSVVLCITGAEALYADMGHFGRLPISRSWWRLVYPSLLLNYFGQGAMLLNPKVAIGHNLFFSLIPSWGLVPLIILAMAATVIASQAMISGSYSLVQQAIALGAFPRQRVVHTNPEVEGQIYLPFVNWSLMVGCILLVIIFKTPGNLAAAYGIAVTGTMAITTIGLYLVARRVWQWRRSIILPICLLILLIDLVYFSANLLKFLQGGYVPMLIASVLFAIMNTWWWGRGFVARCYQQLPITTVKQLINAKANPATMLLDRSLVVMASRPVSALSDTIPPALQSRLDHLGAIYRHITLLSVIQHPGVREIEREHRYWINELQDDPQRGSLITVQIYYGYMQDPDLLSLLPELVSHGGIRCPNAEQSFTLLSGSERMIAERLPWLDRWRLKLFRILLRNSNSVLKYFNLDNYPDITTEVVNLGRPERPASWLVPHTRHDAPVERYL